MLAKGLTAYLGLTAHIRLADHRVHLHHALQTAKLSLSQLPLLPAASSADKSTVTLPWNTGHGPSRALAAVATLLLDLIHLQPSPVAAEGLVGLNPQH